MTATPPPSDPPNAPGPARSPRRPPYWSDLVFTTVVALGLGSVGGAVFDREMLGDPIPWFPAAEAVAVDGDTVRVTVLLHLDGMDAPEIDRSRCPGEKERGMRSHARATELLAAQPVRVKILGEDRWGRMRARVVAGDRPVAATLEREGHVQQTEGAGQWCPDDTGAAEPGPVRRTVARRP